MSKNPKFQNKHVGQDGWRRLRMRTCTWMKWSIIIAAVAPPAEKAKSAGSKVNFTMGPSGPGSVPGDDAFSLWMKRTSFRTLQPLAIGREP